MRLNQNETTEERIVSRVATQRTAPASRVATQPSAVSSVGRRLTRPAFTLTELLVVITIIAILAGLITAAAVNALGKGKQTAIKFELQQISSAIEEFKNQYGSYPPNSASPTPALEAAHRNDLLLMFKRAFPRHREDEELIETLCGADNIKQLGLGMFGSEGLVFWLGGFSEDERYPISGEGGPSFVVGSGEDFSERTNKRFEFNVARLGPRNSTGQFSGRSITYPDPVNSSVNRRINLWTYKAEGSEEPFFYFDTSRNRAQIENGENIFVDNYDPWFYATDNGTDNQRYAIKQPNATNNRRTEFANQGKFQVLHCGIDDLWGNFDSFSLASGSPILFPEGPFLGEVADTLGNFMTGTLADEQE